MNKYVDSLEGTTTTTNIITSAVSDVIDISGIHNISVNVANDVNTPAAVTSPAGRVDTTTFTFPDVATAANGDYFVVKDTTGTSWAVALSKEDEEEPELTNPEI